MKAEGNLAVPLEGNSSAPHGTRMKEGTSLGVYANKGTPNSVTDQNFDPSNIGNRFQDSLLARNQFMGIGCNRQSLAQNVYQAFYGMPGNTQPYSATFSDLNPDVVGQGSQGTNAVPLSSRTGVTPQYPNAIGSAAGTAVPQRLGSPPNMNGSRTVVATQAVNALQKELYNINDALGILCSVAKAAEASPSNKTDENAQSDGASRMVEYGATIRLPGVLNMLPPALVETLIDAFFERFEVFFPYVHQQFRDLSKLAAHPLLISVICALGARSDENAEIRALVPTLWEQCRSLVTDLAWTTPNSGGRGKDDIPAANVLAVILLVEWVIDDQDSVELYNRVSWMHMCANSQLALFTRVLETNKDVFVAVYAIDHVVACRLGVRPSLTSPDPPPAIADELTIYDRAQVDVTRLLHRAYETIYPSRSATRSSVKSGTFLALLEMMQPQFEQWLRDYDVIIRDTESLQARALTFEFNHCQLYTFSLALNPAPPPSERHSVTSNVSLTQSRRFLNIAIDAAVAVIDFLTDPHNPAKLSRAPMRCVVRLIHAGVFLAKALLSTTLTLPIELKEAMRVAVTRAADGMNSASHSFKLMGTFARMMNLIRDQVTVAPFSSTDVNTVAGPPTGKRSFNRFAAERPPSRAPNSRKVQESPMGNSDVPSFENMINDPGDSVSTWDMLGDPYLLAGVDNTMLYMPSLEEIEQDLFTSYPENVNNNEEYRSDELPLKETVNEGRIPSRFTDHVVV